MRRQAHITSPAYYVSFPDELGAFIRRMSLRVHSPTRSEHPFPSAARLSGCADPISIIEHPTWNTLRENRKGKKETIQPPPGEMEVWRWTSQPHKERCAHAKARSPGKGEVLTIVQSCTAYRETHACGSRASSGPSIQLQKAPEPPFQDRLQDGRRGGGEGHTPASATRCEPTSRSCSTVWFH
ncbi:hypothetical protein LZ30DRAFT_418616 [Colletotrichum cereale]|nr:hypothetical protein LZ30DRAFT_418616 [Colletotrichum cereale]